MDESTLLSELKNLYRSSVPSVVPGGVSSAGSRGTSFELSVEGDVCLIRILNETGEGTIRFVTVMPGVYLSFNEFNMARCFTGFAFDGNHISVNHCRAGRIEQALPGGTYSYTARGDLRVSDFVGHAGTYVFPTEHYSGVAVDFDIDVCEEPIRCMLDGFPVSVRALRKKFCHAGLPFVLHDCSAAEHVFSELYTVGQESLRVFAKVKMLDLLLLLDRVDGDDRGRQVEYFQRAQVEGVKRACALMVADLTRSYGVGELARLVGLSTTALKSCFKGVYGMPPYTYLRTYRMERAAEMLRQGELSVSDIAVTVGYGSPSKFTAAFKALMGVTPSAYRRARREEGNAASRAS
jgi:hypothetical protein